MKNIGKKPNRGRGVKSFEENQNYILSEIQKGKPASLIYNVLKKQKKVEIGERAFRKYISRLKKSLQADQVLASSAHTLTRSEQIIAQEWSVATTSNHDATSIVDDSSMRLSDEEMRLQLGLPLENEQSEEGANNE